MTYAVPLTRREAVLRQLRTEIVSGELAAGELIKDAEVARRLGVSITPIREAIAQLAAEGLVDIAPNRTRRVTTVTAKTAVDLLDVMQVLACAGFAWGATMVTADQRLQMRRRFEDFEQALARHDTTAALAAGADVSSIVISASGNHELQTHVDLVVARTQRLLSMARFDGAWRIWRDGYRDCLAYLDESRPEQAAERYRQIYADYRAELVTQLLP